MKPPLKPPASPMEPFCVMLVMGALRKSSMCVKVGCCPVENVMSSLGSLMNMTPALNSWRPLLQVKSSRNWYLCWSVSCGVLGFWPTVTPFGKIWVARSELAPMWLWEYEYWDRKLVRRPRPSTVFRFMLSEWTVFLLVTQLSSGDCGLAPYGWLLLL